MCKRQQSPSNSFRLKALCLPGQWGTPCNPARDPKDRIGLILAIQSVTKIERLGRACTSRLLPHCNCPWLLLSQLPSLLMKGSQPPSLPPMALATLEMLPGEEPVPWVQPLPPPTLSACSALAQQSDPSPAFCVLVIHASCFSDSFNKCYQGGGRTAPPTFRPVPPLPATSSAYSDSASKTC